MSSGLARYDIRPPLLAYRLNSPLSARLATARSKPRNKVAKYRYLD